MEAINKIRKQLESGGKIDSSQCLVKIAKLTREVQRLTGLVESKDFELQRMPRLVMEATCLREELPKIKRNRNPLMIENRGVSYRRRLAS